MIFLITSLLFPCFFLLGSALMTACSTALLHLGKFKSKEFLRSPHRPHFFFFTILKKFFQKQEWENLYFSLSLTKTILQLGYAVSAFFYLMANVMLVAPSQEHLPYLLAVGGAIIAISLFLDFLTRLAANLWARPTLMIAAPFASIYLLLFFPIHGLLLHFTRGLLRKAPLEEEMAEQPDKSRIREMISESELEPHLDATDQKLITSFVNFKERVSKEIMVPRIDVFALDENTSIREAGALFAKESYSRVPIYRESFDQITGVILYKDLLKCYTDKEFDLNQPLLKIAKSVLFRYENQKIAQLFQELRNSKAHLAIIVNEYGDTEGIVTMEDILEELLGDIEDEYDIGEERLFWEIPDGGWIVDAKMTLHDIEEHLGIRIPESPEYETIGGYVLHCKGSIPPKGWFLSTDDFDLEVLISNDRAIKKIKLTPRKN
jgi:putative hemolysin